MKYYEVIFSIDSPAAMLQDCRDVLSAMVADIGFESFVETDNGLTGYVQQNLFDREALENIIQLLPLPQCNVTFTVAEAEDKDWNEQWELEGFEPIVITSPSPSCGQQIIIHDGRHLPLNPSANAMLIEIDARMAFGTGTHQTTRLMVSAMMKLPLEGKRVLDCGTGTGILSIAALKLGALEAIGYDIDEWSVDNARHNAIINQVDNRFTSLLGNVTVLREIEGKFFTVVANINRNILLADMLAFSEKLAQGGWLVMSGFYSADATLLIDKADSLGLQLEWQQNDGEWECLIFRKKD